MSDVLDKYCKPVAYKIRPNNKHFDDSKNHNDKWQKEVYVYANELMKNNGFSKIIDIGCGSGYKLIKYLHEEEGLGYRKISQKLNSWGIKTQRNKQWSNNSVFSVLQKKHQRDKRIEKVRNKSFPIKISKLFIRYSLF